jgi:uncharacterized HAD superfamily protein
MSATITRIGLDIDDVTAELTDAVRLWANNVAGADLQPYHYQTQHDFWVHFKSVWAENGLSHLVDYNKFNDQLAVDQSHVKVIPGARKAIAALKQKYEIVFITSRGPTQYDATRQWLDKHIDPSIPLYLANNPTVQSSPQSKGQLCVELDVQLLIDDNAENCLDAIDNGADAILFGDYGWNAHAPDSIHRCCDWTEVLRYLDDR